MADDVANRNQGLPIPRAYEPTAQEAKMIRVEGDMGSLLVGNHVWDTDSGAWVKMQQPILEINGDVYAAVDQIEQYILDTLLHYKISDVDDGNATYDYYGFLTKGGKWYIMRKDKSGGDAAFRYVKGDSGYNWSNRASETYQDFATVF